MITRAVLLTLVLTLVSPTTTMALPDADVPVPTPVPVTITVDPGTVEVGQQARIDILAAPAIEVAIDLLDAGGVQQFGQFSTDAGGHASAVWTATKTGSHTFSARVVTTGEMANATVLVVPAEVDVAIDSDTSRVRSESPLRVSAVLALRTGVPWASGVQFEYKPWKSPWRTLTAGTTGPDGVTEAVDRPWKETQYRIRFPGDAQTRARDSRVLSVGTLPAKRPVKRPRKFPEPIRKHRRPDRPRPKGAGANPVVRPIPHRVFKRMRGVSWTPGCVPRSNLRYVTTNYWGFDGYRYRGEIVVHASIARNVASIFRAFYRIRYPIRQMRLVDDFGRSRWKGANDYRSMAADNTSAFNCRYVVGREPHVLSPHASGHSIDINPWENPYISPRGVYPNRAYLRRSVRHPALFRPGNAPRRIMSRHGCSWLGYSDTQHFDCWSTGPRHSAAMTNGDYPERFRHKPGDKYGWGME